ncbi:hypothetical protein Fmac_002500 [Flemingia macrophylla]|uniref:Polyol transporter n=1 Tax=Flemingia macrophylla TaxID=520843 RepID=A0ABD1NMX7_9FABA
MLESPRWLVMQGHLKKARNVLSKFSNSEEEVEMRFYNIKVATRVDENDSNKEMAKFAKKNNGERVWKELFVRPTYAVHWMLLVAIGIHFFKHATGIEVIMLYSPRIFKIASTSKNKLFLTAIEVGITKVICLIMAKLFLDRVGRRCLLLGQHCHGAAGGHVSAEEQGQVNKGGREEKTPEERRVQDFVFGGGRRGNFIMKKCIGVKGERSEILGEGRGMGDFRVKAETRKRKNERCKN